MGVEKRQVWNQPWYDVTMLQGGHSRNPSAVAAYRQVLDHKPTRPVIEGECKYEGIHGFTAGEIRHAAYRAMQAGCCGFTYGSHGLWYPTQSETDRKFDEWGPPMAWWQAYKRPGGAQMKHLRACYESLEWWRLEPLPDVVRPEPKLDEQKRILGTAGVPDLLPLRLGESRRHAHRPRRRRELRRPVVRPAHRRAKARRRVVCPRRRGPPAEPPVRRGLGPAAVACGRQAVGFRRDPPILASTVSLWTGQEQTR